MSEGSGTSETVEKHDGASSVSEDGVAEYQGFDHTASQKVQELARTFSGASSIHADNSLKSFASFSQKEPVVPYAGELDPRLDPNSSEFNSKLWVMNITRLMNADPDYYKQTSLGVTFKNLRCSGVATDADYQATFDNAVGKFVTKLVNETILHKKPHQFDILKPMDGILKPGKLCVVLGKPGAGCTTFLKTIATQTYGFDVDPSSEISYSGLTSDDMHNHFRGEVVYCAETENHFPNMTVGQTLKFAARMRAPENRPPGITREQYAEHMTDVIMATYGLLHTKNSKVGNDYIRGVSGGERKRVSICEAALSGSQVQCWDNSTRGLDSATALEFIKALKTSAVISNKTPVVAIYQCSQPAYDIFDTVQLLYEGYQIYFGDSKKAKDYFLRMGYECPQRQTTADYLTSITSPSERIIKAGMEEKVPKTPKEFYDYWMASPEHAELLVEIDEFNKGEIKSGAFKEAHIARQAKRSRPSSPYVVSYGQQIKYLLHRNFLRIKGDPSITLFTIIGQSVMGLIISSVFYNLRDDTGSFYYRTAAVFFSVLFNAFGSLLEVFALYEARPILEKHKTYALYHPSADAFASIISEFPTKICIALSFNLVFYFMVNLKREPGPFFFYLLLNFTGTLAMSHIMRTIGSATKTLSEAMTPASLMLSSLVIFTGFVIPLPNMHRWCFWIYYLNPVAYVFESLIVNEFHGRKFPCGQYIPTGPGYPTTGDSVICTPVSSVAGQSVVNGDDYVSQAYQYKWNHRWRNFGICLAFVIFFLGTYIFMCEFNLGSEQKGEVLLFQKRYLQKLRKEKNKADIEAGGDEKLVLDNDHEANAVSPKESTTHKNIFHWRDLTYQVKIKSEDRVILNNVSGYVKPGTVTALMGASGAGKTTLLNALSERLTTGVITNGTRMVNGRPLDNSFQRSIGYVQQQDLHLQTSTVHEALVFSAKLRQPLSVPLKEKMDYVEYVIDLLEMRPYANAVVGVAGEGLNVEQRKRLTIGVELAAKPELLVFLDEPTSGLDSQTAWSICQLIRKLANHGHAILCTIHQPSAMLMQEFDRLLFLQRGGQTIYFGPLGQGCTTMINYFEKYGAPKCPTEANPAEWMLEVIGAAPGSHANQNYHDVWKNSSEFQDLNKELDTMEQELVKIPVDDNPERFKSYAVPIWRQYLIVTKRVFQQTWRTPSYTYSKLVLSVGSALFNGFVFFRAPKTLMGMQSQMFSVFMFLMPYNPLVQQYLPHFVFQRELYEARERPSKTFSWVAFITAQITSEIPWQMLCGTISFFCWYYPAGFQHNASEAGVLHQRGALMWILVLLYYVWISTMVQLCVSFMEIADNAANLASLTFTLCLVFCGVMAGPKALPGFWIFLYRCNPATYLIGGLLAVATADSAVKCATKELLHFAPAAGETCQAYMSSYIKTAGGYLTEASKLSTTECEYCTIADTNAYLATVSIYPSQIPRNIGIFSVFIFFNIGATIFFYWLARVPKGSGKRST